jgi:hypothetical protein
MEQSDIGKWQIAAASIVELSALSLWAPIKSSFIDYAFLCPSVCVCGGGAAKIMQSTFS